MDQYTSTKQRVRVPAQILTWPVGYTSRKVYVALLVFQLRAQRHGCRRILKTYEEIAALSGVKNVKTVANSVRELADAGYIEVKANMYWSEDLKMLYRGTNEYTIIPMAAMDTGYIWLPVRLLAAHISPAAFTVLLFLLMKQGRNTRCWPSLRRGFQSICQKNGKAMPRKTICAALEQLRRCLMLIVLPCCKRNTARSMNSYMLTVWGNQPACTVTEGLTSAGDSDVRGGYLFGGLPVRTKITQRLLYREREKGVFQFGGFHKKLGILKNRIKNLFSRLYA